MLAQVCAAVDKVVPSGEDSIGRLVRKRWAREQEVEDSLSAGLVKNTLAAAN